MIFLKRALIPSVLICVSLVSFAQTPVKYLSFNKLDLMLYAWHGNKVAILSRKQDLDKNTMGKWLKVMDSVYSFYQRCTGKTPSIIPQYYINGHSTIADVSNTCGAGCGYLGFTGIELLNSFFDDYYNAIHHNNEYRQELFYEFGRNFWFYTDQIAYKKDDPVTTGYAVFMRFLAMESTGVNGAPFGNWTFKVFQEKVVGLIDKYMKSPALTWQNTLGINKGVPDSELGATDLFASFCFRLRRDYGGNTFVTKLWKSVSKRPVAKSTQDAVDNFFLASCEATNRNLSRVFQSWKWPLSKTALAESSKFKGAAH
ncbi:hypothetical protein [Paraflavitalea pollutisoli]|uniref:hypothetical protein n=1 Tax=Paraflavitalea pollutisoli TaxID=3034143 RepID=UPI0023EC1EC9|nr:hypothetical protein [Paraflavitalea sp. H1-2-19X]